MKNPKDPRHLARWIAIQKIFTKNFFDENKDTIDFSSFSIKELKKINYLKNSAININLVKKLVAGTIRNKKKIDKIIKKLAPLRPIKDIAKVDLQILYLAIFEGFIANITPKKVAIDEAVELAREFGGPKSPQFINGVLGNLLEENKTLIKKTKNANSNKKA